MKQKCRRNVSQEKSKPGQGFLYLQCLVTQQQRKVRGLRDQRPVLSLETLREQQVYSPRVVLPFPARLMAERSAADFLSLEEEITNHIREYYLKTAITYLHKITDYIM